MNKKEYREWLRKAAETVISVERYKGPSPPLKLYKYCPVTKKFKRVQ